MLSDILYLPLCPGKKREWSRWPCLRLSGHSIFWHALSSSQNLASAWYLSFGTWLPLVKAESRLLGHSYCWNCPEFRDWKSRYYFILPDSWGLLPSYLFLELCLFVGWSPLLPREDLGCRSFSHEHTCHMWESQMTSWVSSIAQLWSSCQQNWQIEANKPVSTRVYGT